MLENGSILILNEIYTGASYTKESPNMNAITTAQEVAEQQVYNRLQAHDPATVAAFAEHCELWLDRDMVRQFLATIIQLDDRRWPFLRADMRVHCPKLAAAFDRITEHVERHRAEFIEEEACILMARTEGEEA